MLTEQFINSCTGESVWDLGNGVLYELCKKNPGHSDPSEVVAKVWIIGRSYAAAIERRKSNHVKKDEDFYIDKVAPKICNSDIDIWFDELKSYRTINEKSLPTILLVHRKLTDLFEEISGIEKRSLASKYLHFHFPSLFFIYDSRAVKAISKLKEHTGRAGKSKYDADNDYRKLFEKCLELKRYIDEKYGMSITPRQIDNILLELA